MISPSHVPSFITKQRSPLNYSACLCLISPLLRLFLLLKVMHSVFLQLLVSPYFLLFFTPPLGVCEDFLMKSAFNCFVLFKEETRQTTRQWTMASSQVTVALRVHSMDKVQKHVACVPRALTERNKFQRQFTYLTWNWFSSN